MPTCAPTVSARTRPTAATAGARRHGVRTVVRVVGAAVAVIAVALCVRTAANQWNEIRPAIADANLAELALAMVLSVLSMTGLAVLWRRVLATFGVSIPLRSAIRWYFAGELGKYLPGGVWQVVGRGELATRGGVDRSVAYATTVVSMGVMCVGAAVVCAVLSPWLALDANGIGWEMSLLLLIPVGIGFLHPVVFGRLLLGAAKVSRGRVDLQPPAWGRMCVLVLWSCPTWLLLGGASVLVTDALGFDPQPARVAFAAVAAWIVGFLAVPVPAGAGIRELVFVGICGLAPGPATAVAALARLLLLITDAGGGALGLTAFRRPRTRGNRALNKDGGQDNASR
ncbi:MAG: lysylphosphatidylglycerol synthase transmembrane domain-containing protein [bacterium]